MTTRIDAPGGQAAGRDINNNYYGPASVAPPLDHPNARECPQCSRATWEMTRHCLHCGLDLFALDSRERRRKMACRRVKVMLSMVVISGVCVYGSRVAPESFRLVLLGVGVLAMLIAGAMVRE